MESVKKIEHIRSAGTFNLGVKKTVAVQTSIVQSMQDAAKRAEIEKLKKELQQSKIDAFGVKSDKKKVGRPVVPKPKLNKKRKLQKPALPKAKKNKPSGLFHYF